MSSKGNAPAASAGDDIDDAGGASASSTGADTTAAGDDTDDDSSSVLLTVKQDADGNFVLIQGDEDESDEGGEPSMEGGASPEGETFDSVGALLKAIGDICKNAQSAGASDEENFDSGFSASKQPTAAS